MASDLLQGVGQAGSGNLGSLREASSEKDEARKSQGDKGGSASRQREQHLQRQEGRKAVWS